MKKYYILSAVLLTSCAHNDYAPLPDTNASQQYLKTDLRACQHEANVKYHDSQSGMSGGQVAGVALGGVIGGALGGAVIGATMVPSSEDHAMKLSELDPYIDRCMLAKGYSGHSY